MKEINTFITSDYAEAAGENAFGLLSQVFRVFYTPIAIASDVVDIIFFGMDILIVTGFHSIAAIIQIISRITR